MNACRSLYSAIVVNQPKKIIAINTKQTRYLRSIPQENNTSAKINGNAHAHCPSSVDHRFGYVRIFLVCSIQVHPFARLLGQTMPEVAWVEEGHMTPLHIIPHRSGLSRYLPYIGFFSLAQQMFRGTGNFRGQIVPRNWKIQKCKCPVAGNVQRYKCPEKLGIGVNTYPQEPESLEVYMSRKTCKVQRGHGRCCDLDPRPFSPSICSFCPCCVPKKIKSAFISGKNRQEQQRGSRKGKPGKSPLTCHASCLKRCLT